MRQMKLTTKCTMAILLFVWDLKALVIKIHRTAW